MWLRHSALFVVLAAHGGGAAYLNTYTGNSTKLKALLIDGYDPTTPAMGNRDPSANIFGSAAGTDVRMLLRIYKVVKVDPAQGMMSLRTNLVLEWTDKRLSWNPDDYGGVPEVYFNAHGVHDLELTQIWTPDLVLLNSVDGETTSFVPSLAKVKDDGSVQWNRKGDVHVLCRFSGLSAFPFDSLKCQAVFGAVALSEAVQGIGPANPDFSFLDEADLPGSHSDCHFYHPTLEPELLQAYAEYDITNISCAKAVDYTTGKSLIKYTVTFKRSSSFYGMMVLLPSVLFSYMSFVAFFMSYKVGERLGFGVTLVLTTEVAKGALTAVMPVCGELLWVQLFYLLNLFFTSISLLESCLVLGLAYNTRPTLLPHGIFRHLLHYLCHGKRATIETVDSGLSERLESTAGCALRTIEQQRNPSTAEAGRDPEAATGTPRWADGAEDVPKEAAASLPDTESLPDTPRDAHMLRQESVTSKVAAEGRRVKSSMIGAFLPGLKHRRQNAAMSASHLQGDDAAKLIYYERLFHELDPDADGSITLDECRGLLSYTALSLTIEEREQKLVEADSEDGNGQLNIREFVDLCISVLWDVEIEQLSAAAKNYSEAKVQKLNRVNVQWLRVANRIDREMRFWIPLLYTLMLVNLFNIDLYDPYEFENVDGKTPSMMQKGLMEFETRPGWVVLTILLTFGFMVVAYCTAAYKKYARFHDKARFKKTKSPQVAPFGIERAS